MSTRQMSKLAEEASSSGGAMLQDMIDEATIGLGSSGSASGNMEDVEYEQPHGNTVCTITDVDEKPFPLMQLPAEIRNEIYRACLTRPFNILLSKREPPAPEPEPEKEGDARDSSDAEDEVEDLDGHTAAASHSLVPSLSLAGSSAQSAAGSSNPSQATGLRAWASRSTRPIRLLTSRSSVSASNGNANSSNNSGVVFRRSNSRPNRIASHPKVQQPREPRPQDADPLIVNVLRVSKTVYQEARSILYSENLFTLDLDTALPTLAALHQRSRRQIKHVELEIPCYNEILERFQETVRLSLRYCWGLKQFVINMPFTLPGADGSGTTGNTTVYANGFDILRWLPKQCEVVLKGNLCTEIEAVVSKNANLAKTLDEVRRAAFQHNVGGWLLGERPSLIKGKSDSVGTEALQALKLA